MAKKKTHEEFIHDIELINKNIEILETYKKTIDEIKIIINNKGMELLFNAVYEFQKQNMSNQHLPLAHDIVPSFEFILTDQDEYKNAIEKV